MEKIVADGIDELVVMVDGKEYKAEPKELCRVNEEDLYSEITEQASTYVWYATVLALYESKADRKKYELENKEVELDRKARSEAADGGTKITEKSIAAAIKDDARYQLLYEEYLDTREVVGKLRALVVALAMKKDMLIQIGARKRKEYGMDGFSK